MRCLHVVIEELLELLVDKVDGYLLKSIVLEHFKASNVQDGNKVRLFLEGEMQVRTFSRIIVVTTHHGGINQSLIAGEEKM